MTADQPLLITFGVYLLAMIGIGVWAWRSTRSFDDYILGGRSLGSFVTALSAGASDMSGWLLLGLPGALYLSGASEAWIALGLIVGAWCNWKFVAGPLRIYTERTRNALTLPDYFTHRFEDKQKLLRVFSAVVILVFFAWYCASGIVAGARLFESVFGVPYAQALWWGAAATIVYTLIGGFLAVSWTDTVQASLMIFALILTPIMVVLGSGGVDASLALIERTDPSKLDWFNGGALGVVGIVSLMAWGLGYFGQPHILARFMAADSLNSIPKARRIGMSWMVLCLFGAMAVGFFANAYFAQHPDQLGQVADNHERVFIQLATVLFNPWVAGVLLSAILAAIMSTLSCQLLVCSSALTEDFYKGFVRPNASQRELVWFGRSMVLLVALLAIWIARDPNSKVLGLVAYAWAGFGAAFGPVVLFSLFWARMTRNGALAGMLVGAATVITWEFLAKFAKDATKAGETLPAWLDAIAPALGLYSMLPGVVAASLAIVLFSKLGRPPSDAMQFTHKGVMETLKVHGY
jgi:sodium/proline symporter